MAIQSDALILGDRVVVDLQVSIPCKELKKPNADTQRLRNVRLAKLVSSASLLASLVIGAIALYFGIYYEAIALFGFAAETLLDAVSSALVLWRFKTAKDRVVHSPEHALEVKEWRDGNRERNSSLGIGGTFILLALLLTLLSTKKLGMWGTFSESTKAEHDAGVISFCLSTPSIFIFCFLGIAKVVLAQRLSSQVLWKDALCSLLGSLLALIVLVTGTLEMVTPADEAPDLLKHVDSFAAIAIAMILGVEGVRTLFHNRHGVGTKPVALPVQNGAFQVEAPAVVGLPDHDTPTQHKAGAVLGLPGQDAST